VGEAIPSHPDPHRSMPLRHQKVVGASQGRPHPAATSKRLLGDHTAMGAPRGQGTASWPTKEIMRDSGGRRLRPSAPIYHATQRVPAPITAIATQGNRHSPHLPDTSRRYRKRHASPTAVAPFTPWAGPAAQRTGEAWRSLPRHAAIPARPPRAVGSRRPMLLAMGNRLARWPPTARL